MGTYYVIIIGLGGLILYNLGKSHAEWLDDRQKRLEKLYGQKHGNINMSNVLSRWQPLFNPSYFATDETKGKKVRARMKTYSQNPQIRKEGVNEVSTYNYRRRGGTGPAPVFVTRNNI